MGGKTLRRSSLQLLFFLVLFIVSIPQTKLLAQKADVIPGQKTLVYNLTASDEDYNVEEILAQDDLAIPINAPTWRQGAIEANETGISGVSNNWQNQDIAGIFAGGMAISKPTILPGASIGATRNRVLEYIIMPGDSLSSIAYQFDVSIPTILWQNNLTIRSLIKPGQKLLVPPTSGVMHTVKKGDTIQKISKLYGAKTEDIISFNNIKADGSDIGIGEIVMVPGGARQQSAMARAPRTSPTYQYRATPPSSGQAPGASGFIWPSGGKLVTQYYNYKHHAIDIAGAPMGTPNYAAKAGMVLVSQCGWNSGYGCYVILDHGNGVKTLYGHNSRLLVSAGDHVEQGQTIALMGNTGKVRGVTGIHLHFEIIINGGRANPLGYVR